MDFFVEQLVERKKTPLHILAVLGLAALCFLVAYMGFFVLMPQFPMFGSIIFMITALLFYLSYKLAVSFNVEFEYSMVNTEIDVDKIINQKKRKRLTTVNVRKLEDFGTVAENCEFKRYAGDVGIKKIYACRDRADKNNFFVLYNDGSIRTVLVFSPNEKIRETVEKYSPRKF